MAFTVESIDVPLSTTPTNQPNQFNLPVKEISSFDPKGERDPNSPGISGSTPSVVKQEDTPESKEAEEPALAPEETVTLSPKISALARKEQLQRQKEIAFRQREKAFEAKLADAEKYAQLKAKLAQKDYSAVDELGIPYEDFAKYEVDKLASQDPAELRTRKLEAEISDLKKQQEEQTIREYQANQNLWKQEISKVVSENEAYSTIKELKAENLVLQHINDSFDEDGVELTAEQAAQEIEDALVERAEKFASVSKVRSKFEQSKVLGPPKASTKTITQNLTVTSEKPSSKPFHLMSESEQLAEAIRRVQASKNQR